jgi:anaerobic dimethyl sulfoxide reductase subunit B (iron-sulfur subunit)
MACPYKALQFDPASKVMTKCNFCLDLLDEGNSPACVSACQMRVLHFGDLEELRAEFGGIDNIYPFPNPQLTKPAVVVTPHPDAVRSDDQGAKLGNLEEI